MCDARMYLVLQTVHGLQGVRYADGVPLFFWEGVRVGFGGGLSLWLRLGLR